MLRTKPTFLKKLNLLVLAALILVTFGTATAFADTPDTKCTGDATKCTCDTKHPNCGTDPATVPLQDCAKIYGKNSDNYTVCRQKSDLVKTYLNPIIKFLTYLVGLAVVIGIIVGGIQYIMSAGDPQAAANGKNHIRNAVIAFILYLFLFALLNFLVPGGIV